MHHTRILQLAGVYATLIVLSTAVATNALTASDDYYRAEINVALAVAAPGVLANDSGANAPSMSAALDTPPSHGIIDLHADGSFAYTPAPGFAGEDAFVYHATDGSVPSSAAVANIMVARSSSCDHFASVSAGQYHTVALRDDGTVWTWGYNCWGQLADGTATNSSIPVQVPGLTDVKAVSAGLFHSVALKKDGTVWAWGYNYYGLGNGSIRSDGPVQVSSLTDITAISAGPWFTLALRSDGTVWGWGHNSAGELGRPVTGDGVAFPARAENLTGIKMISAGDGGGLALKCDGTVWGWGHTGWAGGQQTGSAIPLQLPNLEHMTAVACGCSAALKDDGTVWHWTCLGGAGGTYTNMPPAPIPDFSGVTAIVAGSSHILSLKEDGSVWAWGSNSDGQLGDGTTKSSLIPVCVAGLSGVTSISAGSSYSVAIKGDGSIWSWGSNGHCELGAGTTPAGPAQVAGLGSVKAVAAGWDYTAALKTDGTVWQWGATLEKDGRYAWRTVPLRVPNLDGITAIAAGDSHTVALRNDGTVWCWGSNYFGQLGDMTAPDSAMPVRVPNVTEATCIATGAERTYAVNGGMVWSWGTEWNGSWLWGNPPGQISDLTGVKAIAAGMGHTVALMPDGTVRTGGYNCDGEWGDGTFYCYSDLGMRTSRQAASTSATAISPVGAADWYFPAYVLGLSNVKAIAAGEFHTLALDGDGTVWGWGSNFYGELGDGVIGGAPWLVPQQVWGLTGVTAIAAADGYGVAARNDGTVWEWGGGCGPTKVVGPSGVTAVAVGAYSHTVALTDDGTVWTWGDDTSGQLGYGIPIFAVPVPLNCDSLAPSVTIGSAKAAPDGQLLSIPEAVVTAEALEPGYIFVESPDRASGIKVITDRVFAVGQHIRLTGRIGKVDGEYQLSEVTYQDAWSAEAVAPVGTTVSTIANALSQSSDCIGLSTTGLLIRVAGKVTSVDAARNVAYVDDGMGYRDDFSQCRGIRVHLQSGVSLPLGCMVIVTGISRVERRDSVGFGEANQDASAAWATTYVPTIWTRDSNDIRVL